MNDRKPFSTFHRRALGAIADEVQAEQLTQAAIRKARMSRRVGLERVDTRAGCGGRCNQGRADCECVQLSGMVGGALTPYALVPIQPAIQIYRVPLLRRLARWWREFVNR